MLLLFQGVRSVDDLAFVTAEDLVRCGASPENLEDFSTVRVSAHQPLSAQRDQSVSHLPSWPPSAIRTLRVGCLSF
jgi:hypothetical protein